MIPDPDRNGYVLHASRRELYAELFEEPLIDPAGNLKMCRYHFNLCPPQLDIAAATERPIDGSGQQGRPTGLRLPNLHSDYHRAGWRRLRDLYADEGRHEEWQAFKLVWEHKLTTKQPHPEWDDNENLPAEVIRRRQLRSDTLKKGNAKPLGLKKKAAKSPVSEAEPAPAPSRRGPGRK